MKFEVNMNVFADGVEPSVVAAVLATEIHNALQKLARDRRIFHYNKLIRIDTDFRS